MVCGLSLNRKTLEAHHRQLRELQNRLSSLRQRLLENIDRDAQSYEAVMAAFKLPKSTETEKAGRAQAIEEAGKNATSVPLETAELSAEAAKIISSLRDITIPVAAPDLAVHSTKPSERGAPDATPSRNGSPARQLCAAARWMTAGAAIKASPALAAPPSKRRRLRRLCQILCGIVDRGLRRRDIKIFARFYDILAASVISRQTAKASWIPARANSARRVPRPGSRGCATK